MEVGPMGKKFIAFLVIFALLLPSFVFAAGPSINYDVDGDEVTVTVTGESHRPVSIVIEDGSRKYYIDQKETDESGKAVFSTRLEEGKEYSCTVNIDGVENTKTIEVEEEEPGQIEHPGKDEVVYIYIEGYKNEVILDETEVKINKGDTVLSVTKRVLNSKGIDYEVRNGYVSSIDGLSEFDKGPNSGWMFTVNGNFPGIGPGNVTVRDGDFIEWLYTTNLGKDVGNIYKDPKSEIIDEALDLLEDKSAKESEIIDIVEDLTEYIADSIADVKDKDDLKTVLKDLEDINDIFLKLLTRLKTEEGFESAATNSQKIGEKAVKLLSHTDDQAQIEEIVTLVKESNGITLALLNKMRNESKIEKRIEDILDASIELNEKLLEKQPADMKPEQVFSAIVPQEDEDSVEINLPTLLLKKASEKGITKMELSSDIFDIVLPMDALNETQKSQGLKTSVKKADKSNLPDNLQGQIPDGSIIFDISEESGGKFDNPIEVGIAFEAKYNDGEAVTVFLLNDDGAIQPVGGIYDPEAKKAIFLTTHFSKYFAKESTEDFADTKGHWAKREIGILAGKGIINGKANGIFEPDANITRAEFVALITRALGYGEEGQYTLPFTDVSQKDWYYKPIAIAYNKGLVNGKSEKEFDPKGNITRQEMAKIISNLLESKFKRQEKLDDLKKFKDFEKIASWAQESVALCLREKIIKGVTEDKFAPLEKATRAQAATIIYRIYGLIMN